MREDGAGAGKASFRGTGIILPLGTSSRLHRDGETNAFILTFANQEEAQDFKQACYRRRLFRPGHPASISVQSKREPRCWRRDGDRPRQEGPVRASATKKTKTGRRQAPGRTSTERTGAHGQHRSQARRV